MKSIHVRSESAGRRGTALVMMALVVTGLAGLSVAMLTVGLGSSREQRGELEEVHARYVCQAALSQAMYQMHRGQSGAVGTPNAPVAFDRSQFWVTATDMGSGLTQLQATGIDDRSGASMELVVRSVPNTMWRYGAFGREFLHLDSNAKVDSYNSSLGTYASQATNGSGTSLHANEDGDVGSNGGVGLDQNGKVWGDAMAGPGHTTTVLGNAIVSGSTTPSSAQLDLPAINVPTYTSYGALTVTGATTIPSGNRSYTNLRVNSSKTLNITGPANIVISNLDLRSNAQIVVDATAGPVTLYVLDNFIINSNAQIYSTDYRPQNVAINLLSDNVINPEVTVQLDVVDFASNSKIYGTIYAPNAAVVINSNFELFGSLVARSVDLDSNCFFHFDEALISATSSGTPTFETVCWRDIPYQR